jgi:multidrug efflux system outer membrane protein
VARLPAAPAAFKAQASVAAAQAARQSAWWSVYGDAVLDALVAQADVGNTDIRQAASRLAHASALARQSGAPRRPQLTLGASAVRQQGPLLNAAGQEGTLLTASATLAYEVDVLGRLTQAADAAVLDAQARADLLEAARLLTQAQVVQAYLALRALDVDAEQLQQQLALERQSLRIQALRLQAGALSESDYELQHSLTTAQTAERQALHQRRVEQENLLAVLLGQTPSQFQLAAVADWVAMPTRLPADLPASVLARRPDVAAAQKGLLAAQKRLGVAESAWLPGLSLTGTSGNAAPDLGNLFSAAMQTWAFGLLANIAVFDGGRRAAGVSMAEADLQAALASYQNRVLQALREVEDQLSAQQQLAGQADALERAWHSASRAAELAQGRLQNGSISQLEALQAQRHSLQSRRTLLRLRASQLQASAALAQALGGGWS